jgi:hypothetical protein
VQQLLSRLGVPLTGEIEVWEVTGDEQAHLYGGWYLVVGQIVSKPPDEGREFTLDAWRLSWSSGSSYEVPAFVGVDVCELHFLTEAGDFIAPEVAAS